MKLCVVCEAERCMNLYEVQVVGCVKVPRPSASTCVGGQKMDRQVCGKDAVGVCVCVFQRNCLCMKLKEKCTSATGSGVCVFSLFGNMFV